MVEKLDWDHTNPITSTGKNIYQTLQRLTALQDQKVMIENMPITEILVSAEAAEKNKQHALACTNQKIRYEALRELLLKRIVDGKYEFMYANHDIELAKDDWAKIVERLLEEVTGIRAEIDKKREGKGEYKRQNGPVCMYLSCRMKNDLIKSIHFRRNGFF